MKTVITVLCALECGSTSLMQFDPNSIALDEPKAHDVAAEAKRAIARLESEVLSVQPVNSKLLTVEDADAIAKECRAVKHSAPLLRARCHVIYGDKFWIPLMVLLCS
jgi:hypothetical protein